jgi:hypothetical protein
MFSHLHIDPRFRKHLRKCNNCKPIVGQNSNGQSYSIRDNIYLLRRNQKWLDVFHEDAEIDKVSNVVACECKEKES